MLEAVRFAYGESDPVLDIQHLAIERGQRVFLEGPSGSGKSTLLGLIAGVLQPDQGSVRVCGQPLERLTAAARDALRADHIGYIFQLFNLIPWLSVADNVLLPVRFSNLRRARLEGQDYADAATRLLDHMELPPALARRPVADLSVGQQQRVAAARALIGAPELVIADEPTSALDSYHRDRFVDLLLSECEANATTLVYASHDHQLAHHFEHRMAMTSLNRLPS